MKRISKQTMTVAQIVVTAIMIALSIVVIQFVKLPLTISGQNVAVSGALINLILIIDTLYCGLISGILMSILIPILSFAITGAPIISAVPLILPCIMIGNLVIVVAAWLVRCKKSELNLLPLSLLIGSFVKYAVMTLLIVKWVIPTFGTALKAPQITIATATYSIQQLIAALIGTFLACVIWPVLKLAVKR